MERVNPRILTIMLIVMGLFAVYGVWHMFDQQKQINALNFRIMSLQYQNSVLTERCNALESNLSSVFEEFEVEIATLQDDYSTLNDAYLALQHEYDTLEYEFTWVEESSSELEEEYAVYSAEYRFLKEAVNSRLALDGNLSRFVTPDDSVVKEKMIEVTGGLETWGSMSEFWGDSKALHDWITGNIAYAVDSPYPFLYSHPSESVKWLSQSVRYPYETLSDGWGDCEDQAILLLSMMEAHSERFEKWCVSIRWDGGGHVAVGIPVDGGRLAIMDPSGQYHTGSGEGLSNAPVTEALEEWTSLFYGGEVEVNSVFNHEIYIKFENTDEFLAWFNNEYG